MLTPTEEKNHCTFSIKIGEYTHSIQCPPSQIPILQNAARYINQQLLTKLKNPSGAQQRDAVVAALNHCHELLRLQEQRDLYLESINQRMRNLEKKIEGLLR